MIHILFIFMYSTDCPYMAPTDVIFLVDSSLSIGFSEFQDAKTFLTELVDSLEIGSDKVQVGAVKFSSQTWTEFQLDSHNLKSEIKYSIHEMDYTTGVTYTADALKHARYLFKETYGGRQSAQKIALLLTDGASTQHLSYVINQANKLKYDTGAVIFVVAVGSDISFLELLSISSAPQDIFVYRVDSYAALEEIRDAILEIMCDLPETTTTSTTTTTTTTLPSKYINI